MTSSLEMQTIFLALPKSTASYDEHQAFVVAARDPEGAHAVIQGEIDEGTDERWRDQDNYTLEAVGTTRTKHDEVILADFNAG